MDGEDHEVPTFHANLVTMNINADEMVVEFRDFHPDHQREWEKAGAPETGEPVPFVPATARELYNVRPTVRVVITFSAARSIKLYLDQTLDKTAEGRKA